MSGILSHAARPSGVTPRIASRGAFKAASEILGLCKSALRISSLCSSKKDASDASAFSHLYGASRL